MISSNAKKIKKISRRFLKEYNTEELNFEFLNQIITSQGYRIIEFSVSDINENLEELINSLNIGKYIKSRKAFIYQDELHRILFLRRDLSKNEKTILLIHEEGHIYCGHMKNKTVSGQNIHDEFEANEFTHYIMQHKNNSQPPAQIRKPDKKIISVSLFLVFILFCGVFIPREIQNFIYYEKYYVTTSGTKYHKKDCRYVKNKKNLRRLTKKDFEKNLFDPCKICFPELNN